MNLKRISFFLLAIATMVSCDKKRVFDQYVTMPSSSWHRDSILNFDLPEVDTTQTYDLFVNLRTTSDYPFSNLFVIVTLDQPNKLTLVDTLEYQMADANGEMLGEGFSDVKESKLYYKEKFRFRKGEYKVKLQQALRETGKIPGVESLEGVTEVGFRIEKGN
jgi:gliding motility-associated lipoprotein GldH